MNVSFTSLLVVATTIKRAYKSCNSSTSSREAASINGIALFKGKANTGLSNPSSLRNSFARFISRCCLSQRRYLSLSANTPIPASNDSRVNSAMKAPNFSEVSATFTTALDAS
ncbi:hypothetical protein QWZ13_18440 [Reinekea marina]|uniref:hypothetical protein n=1 Tax=Reinekea marina TaxID=1310421 RepID=UPI0025B497C5|nr:hypothetical protein [Reinekea marina]MDN3650891.1 hypothetical protein [Reinekea marina]